MNNAIIGWLLYDFNVRYNDGIKIDMKQDRMNFFVIENNCLTLPLRHPLLLAWSVRGVFKCDTR